MKINWNFQRGGGVLSEKPSVGEIYMDIFWNHTVWIQNIARLWKGS